MKDIFDQLFIKRERIERSIGEELNWERLNDRRASRISIARPFDLMGVDENIAQAKQWGVDMMLKFIDAFRPFLTSPSRRTWNVQSYFEDVNNRLSSQEADAVKKVFLIF